MSGSSSKAGRSGSISKADKAAAGEEEVGKSTQQTPGSAEKGKGNAAGVEPAAKAKTETDRTKDLQNEARSLRDAMAAAEAERDGAAEHGKRMRELLVQQGLGHLLDEDGKPK